MFISLISLARIITSSTYLRYIEGFLMLFKVRHVEITEDQAQDRAHSVLSASICCIAISLNVNITKMVVK